MNLWTWLFGILGVGGLGALALFVFAPATAMSLLHNVAAFLLERVRNVVKWARDPNRNWWKVGCFSFAGFFALASWYADSQRREVVATVTRYETVILPPIKKQAEEAAAAATQNFAALLQCQMLLQAEVGLQADVERQNREAVEAATRAQAKAEAQLREWRGRERSLDCTAALAAMEGKCASFSDY